MFMMLLLNSPSALGSKCSKKPRCCGWGPVGHFDPGVVRGLMWSHLWLLGSIRTAWPRCCVWTREIASVGTLEAEKWSKRASTGRKHSTDGLQTVLCNAYGCTSNRQFYYKRKRRNFKKRKLLSIRLSAGWLFCNKHDKKVSYGNHKLINKVQHFFCAHL